LWRALPCALPCAVLRSGVAVPHAVVLASVGVIYVLYQGEFRSEVLDALNS
jgi:hypothetical protein